MASWSWDDYGPTTPNALHQPAQYTKLLRRAVATMLAPGNGVEGVIFTQFPRARRDPSSTAQTRRSVRLPERVLGNNAWNRDRRKHDRGTSPDG